MARRAQLSKDLQNLSIFLLGGLLLSKFPSSLHLLQLISLGSLTDGLQCGLLSGILLSDHLANLL